MIKTIKFMLLVMSTILLTQVSNAQGPRATRPSITSVSPTSGPEGTLVTIDGINFINTTVVKLKNLSVPFTVVDSFTITFIIPVGATSGQVSVENTTGKTNGGRFTVVPPIPQPPTITSFSPTSDSVGNIVTVTGTNFDNATAVTLNGQSVVFTIIDSVTIEFTVLLGATSGPIRVTNPDGAATSATSFTVLMPYVPTPPTITSFTPTSGFVGTTVTVTGTNFSTATSLSLNGGTSIPFTIVNNTTITFVVLSGATSGPVAITNPDGVATSSSSYTVTVPTFPPTITSISPTSGLVGTTVTITGTNLSTVTLVKLNGTSISFTIVSATSITFVVPTGATSGIVSVTNPDGTVNGPTYTVTTVTPTLPTITRGAYMVGPTSTSINIQWRTNVTSNSEVWYGTSSSALTSVVNNASNVTDHTITLTGLTPNTKYYYSVGVIGAAIQSGTGSYFITAPINGSTDPLRFWVTGDFGNASSNETATKNAFLNYTSATDVNGWLWLGDNAYSNGTDAEYQTNVFNIYGNLFNRLPVFPAPGNHDYGQTGYLSSAALGTNFPYFSIFAIPTNSGTEKYYSINYGNVHLVSLDSYGSQNSLTSAMYTWLDNDLRNNKQPWVIVYWHHAPYTKGSHNSDTEIELIDMRTNIVPLLEQWGVDVVLSGHSHIYERSKFIKGHYGLASTFNNSLYPTGNVVQSNANTYSKASLRSDGTVYTVCGVSGQTGGATSAGYPHPAMQVSTTSNNGSLIIDVNGNTLNVKFLTTAGTVFDQFTITKTAFIPRLSDMPTITDEKYYDIQGKYLGDDYKLLPNNQIIIYKYNKDGEPQVRKITEVN